MTGRVVPFRIIRAGFRNSLFQGMRKLFWNKMKGRIKKENRRWQKN